MRDKSLGSTGNDGTNGAQSVIYKEIIHDTVYNEKRAFTRLDSSKFFEVGLVVEGNGIHRVLDKDIPCGTGDIFIIPSGVPHGYFVEGHDERLVVKRLFFDSAEWLDSDVANPESARFCYGAFSENSTLGYTTLNTDMVRRVCDLYAMIAVEIEERKSEWRSLVKGHVASLLIYVGRYVNVSVKNISFASLRDWDMVSGAMQMVREEYGNPELNGEMVSDRFHISKSQFGRVFTKLVKKSFAEYLRDARLEHAARELKKSRASIVEIALKCGFRDVPTFYKNFNFKFGMTPKKYRTTQKNETYSENYEKFIKGEKIMSILNEISENLQKGKAKIVKELVQQALDEGVKPEDILKEALLEGMGVIGEKFKNNEIYVPQVLVSARAMNMGAEILKPYLVKAGVEPLGKVCIGTVRGDLHDIGKNLVKMMFEGKGFEVIDLGVDVAPEKFIETAIAENCQIICCSALLTTTMGVMADVVKAAENAGIRDKVKIMIGGAPVTEEFCREIGADCYTVDAASAADAAAGFVKA